MTTPRNDVGFLSEVLLHSRKAIVKIEGVSFGDFMRDENLRLAVTHLVMLCGENLSRVSAALRQQHPHVPWRESIAVRNRIIHASFSVDWGVIFEVARDHLPQLARQVEMILKELPPSATTGGATGEN